MTSTAQTFGKGARLGGLPRISLEEPDGGAIATWGHRGLWACAWTRSGKISVGAIDPPNLPRGLSIS